MREADQVSRDAPAQRGLERTVTAGPHQDELGVFVVGQPRQLLCRLALDQKELRVHQSFVPRHVLEQDLARAKLLDFLGLENCRRSVDRSLGDMGDDEAKAEPRGQLRRDAHGNVRLRRGIDAAHDRTMHSQLLSRHGCPQSRRPAAMPPSVGESNVALGRLHRSRKMWPPPHRGGMPLTRSWWRMGMPKEER
jgi:hypothetical protein